MTSVVQSMSHEMIDKDRGGQTGCTYNPLPNKGCHGVYATIPGESERLCT